MSIQFRSRIRSVADYTNHLSDEGVCCKPDGVKISTNYIGCMEVSGYFQYVDCEVIDDDCLASVSCPELSDTGCCCACKYVDDYGAYVNSIGNNESDSVDGLKDDISFCECSRVGGVWAGPNTRCDDYKNNWEDTFSLCTNGAFRSGGIYDIETADRRYPEGCCIELSDGTFRCDNVCSDTECSEKQTSENSSGHGSHYPGIPCNYDPPIGDPIDCGDENYSTPVNIGGLSVPSNRYSNISTAPNPKERKISRRTRKTKQGNAGLVSACVQNKNKNEYECELARVDYCDGCWLGLKKNGTSYSCNDTDNVNVIKNFMRKGTIGRSVIDSWKIGEYQIAGYYAGIFNYGGEKSPYASLEGWGNKETGEGQAYTLENKEGDCKELKSFTENQYAVIVAGSDYLNSDLVAMDKRKNVKLAHKSSGFDSIRNMNLSLQALNTIKRKYTNNGFGSGNVYGWAVPAQHLSAFIYNQTNNIEFITNAIMEKNNPAYTWTPYKGFYWTSTLLDEIKRNKVAYVQNMETGFVGVSNLFRKHRARPVMLLRILKN
jgi:hypothetical protein